MIFRQKKTPLYFGGVVPQILGHTPHGVVCPEGSDLRIFAHFVSQILGHLGFEPRTKGL